MELDLENAQEGCALARGPEATCSPRLTIRVTLGGMQLLDAHRSARRQFDLRVRAVRADQWHADTPDTQWDVSNLVDHLVTGQLRVPDLLAGATLAEVTAEASFDPDGGNLGDDPAAAWAAASGPADEAIRSVDLARTVHLSFGDVPAQVYVEQLTFDLLVHSWDLARAIGGDDSFPNDTVAFVLEGAKQQAPMLAESGLFAPSIPVPGCTDDLTELLALTGRNRWWTCDIG